MTLEEKILLLRKKNGLSQDELAQQLGVTRQAVYKWESGNAIPEMEKIKGIAKLFGVSFDYLLDDSIKEYEANNNEETKINHREIYVLGDKQDFMQGDIDHGYIKERHKRNEMSRVIFSNRRKQAEENMKKAGATEINFVSEEETIAFFYNKNEQSIGFYYGCGIQLVCPLENLVSINLNGGDANLVNSRTTMLGIGNGGFGIGSVPTTTVMGSFPISVTIMYLDGDIIKDFSFKVMTNCTYLYYEESKSQVNALNDVLRHRLVDRLNKLKTKIEALIYNSSVLVTEDIPQLNTELYNRINLEAKEEYSEYIKDLKIQLIEEQNKSNQNLAILLIIGALLLIGLLFPQLGLLLICAFVIGLIPAFIAKHNGRSFISWWFYGAGLFVMALTHILYIVVKERILNSPTATQGLKDGFTVFETFMNKISVWLYSAALIVGIVWLFFNDVILGIFLLISALLGLYVAFHAKRGGRNFTAWWVYGTFLFLIACVHINLIIDEE